MTCRACIQLPLDVYGIDTSINTQMLKNPHDLLVHSAALENGRNPDIGTLKKEKGYILSEFCTDSFKEKFLRNVNEVLFEMGKKSLKDTYLGGTTPTSLQNEVSTCWKMYYEKDNQVMINKSVNEFVSPIPTKMPTGWTGNVHLTPSRLALTIPGGRLWPYA